MTTKKILFLQSVSSKIEQITLLTLNNHNKYCNKNNYSLLLNNEKYSGLTNLRFIKNLCKFFDIVVTIGSDCIFTDFDKKITSFIDETYYLTASKESKFSEYFNTPVNGEILIFNKLDDQFDVFMDKLIEYQDLIYQSKICQFPDSEGNIMPCSTQGVINTLYQKRFNSPLDQFMRFIEPGILQSYIQKYVKIRITKDEEWDKSKYLTHIFGIPNDIKVKYIEEFFNEYPEYR